MPKVAIIAALEREVAGAIKNWRAAKREYEGMRYKFYENPRAAAVYNLGGGRRNSISVLEAIVRFEELMGGKLAVEYVDQNRAGDHICYISDLRRLRADYPDWDVTRSLDDILAEIAAVRPERAA